MSTIAGIKLSESEVAVLCDLIDGLPDAFLSKKGATLFRVGFTEPAALRVHLKKLVSGKNSVPKVLVDLLSEELPLRELVDGVRADCLEGFLPALAGLHGRDSVRLVLLTSESRKVQQLASKVPENPVDDKAASAKDLLLKITRLVELDPAILSDQHPNPGRRSNDDGETDQTVSEQAEFKELAAVVTAEEDSGANQENRPRVAISDLKNRIAELDAALAAKETALKASTAREGELLERIAELSRTEDKRIAREVGKRLTDIE
ncbi:MAG: hypothetical protein R3F07_11760 [Opitutaceae bacterium]